MKISAKAIVILGVAAIGGIAIYLYLKRTPTTAASPTPHPFLDIPPPSIYGAHLGIAGDDPSPVKGDIRPDGSFYVTTSENRPAVDVFFKRTSVGALIGTSRRLPI